MITPKRRWAASVVNLLGPGEEPSAGYKPVLNNHGIAYWRRGQSSYQVPVEDWIEEDYLRQAAAICDSANVAVGPTPSSTAMRLLRSALTCPLGRCYSFTKTIEERGTYAGGRTEVGRYGLTTGELRDIDFRAAYGTQLARGYGDLAGWGAPISEADFIDATVRDDSEYPILRVRKHGRDFFSRGEARRLLTREEFELTVPITVHQTYSLERRDDLASFAERLLGYRAAYPVAKLLLNSIVGRLRVESLKRPEAVAYPQSGDKYVAPGVFLRQVTCKPSGALAVAARITGAVRADLTRLLRSAGCQPICWDTDGVCVAGYDIDLMARTARMPYKIKSRRCTAVEVWGGKISILTTDDGLEHVRCGGLPGAPSAARLRELMGPHLPSTVAVDGVLRRIDGTYVGRPPSLGGWTGAYRL